MIGHLASGKAPSQNGFNVQLEPDVHRQQLCREVAEHVRNSHQGNVLAAVANDTDQRLNIGHVRRLLHGRREQISTGPAYPRRALIRAVHEAILEQIRGAVGEERVAFHLSKANATRTLTPLDGLAGEVVHRSSGPNLKFIRDHMTEALVVNVSDEDIRLVHARTMATGA